MNLQGHATAVGLSETAWKEAHEDITRVIRASDKGTSQAEHPRRASGGIQRSFVAVCGEPTKPSHRYTQKDGQSLCPEKRGTAKAWIGWPRILGIPERPTGRAARPLKARARGVFHEKILGLESVPRRPDCPVYHYPLGLADVDEARDQVT